MIKVSRGKKLIGALVAICFLWTIVWAQENITITTYYPSPSGAFNNLSVQNNLTFNTGATISIRRSDGTVITAITFNDTGVHFNTAMFISDPSGSEHDLWSILQGAENYDALLHNWIVLVEGQLALCWAIAAAMAAVFAPAWVLAFFGIGAIGQLGTFVFFGLSGAPAWLP